MRQPIPALLLTILLGLSQTTLAALPQPVATMHGQLQGTTTTKTGMSVFRGVPYAAAPVAANRWREPQAVSAWAGVRNATEFAPRCVQGGFAPGAEQALTSEDCLYLNIWTPAETANAVLPVLIWVHGGGFFTGSGSAESYDGEDLASKGAVVITINYRLGSFGFLAHPELSAESPNHSSGNYGMLDVLAAVTWTKENIAAFGGDPDRITLMGESAGGNVVANLVASPLSAGLFQRAILQSGAWMGWGGITRQPSLAEREVIGADLVSAYGATSIAELRQASTQAVFENLPAAGSTMNVDGYLLPKDSSLIFAEGTQQPIDVLAGSNRDEGVFFGPGIQQADAFRTHAQNKFAGLSGRFLALYPATSDAVANASYLSAYTNELAWQLRKMGQFQSRRGRAAWLYFFTHVPPGQEARGATHVAELPYMFNHADQNANWTGLDRQLADQMSSYWVNFAATGNPNAATLPAWPAPQDNAPGGVLVLGDAVTAEALQVPAAEVLDFFDAAFEQHLQALGGR